MEVRVGGLLFTSKFDSGNIARVEKVERDDEEGIAPISITGEPRPDYEFNVWTRPDCAETEYENPNRSWFYFGIKGYSPNRLLKINIQNLNKQGKLYSQGYAPFVRVTGVKPGKWDRIRDKPTFEILENQFVLSFTYRFPDQRGNLIQFAFCYPWSYEECQQKLTELDIKYEKCSELNSDSPIESVYYHRELLCYSLSKLRMDLITISDCHGLTNKTEPRFDSKLFLDRNKARCRRFTGKRVYILTSRVHPGETPGSHVFNGFLDFILREHDPRSKALRRHFVFKLIPILNPDGVLHGHYRTDTRGVNLNRVYLDPDPSVYPTIYAAKSILVYYHVHYRVRMTTSEDQADELETEPSEGSEKADHIGLSKSDTLLLNKKQSNVPSDFYDFNNLAWNPGREDSREVAVDEIYSEVANREMGSAQMQPIQKLTRAGKSDSILHASTLERRADNVKSFQSNFARFDKEFDGEPRFYNKSCRKEQIFDSENPKPADNEVGSRAAHLTGNQSDELSSDRASNHGDDSDDNFNDVTDRLGNEGSDEEGDFTPNMSGVCKTPHLNRPELLEISASRSGVAFYVDLHGHASKRGCFIYGNFLEQEEQMVDCLLYPKLVSMNTAHFDFGGCNFSLKNMYTKDKRDGMTKEGSGRVAMYKALGIVRSCHDRQNISEDSEYFRNFGSYTLECNYNMGRMVNCVPPACGDDGRATPPPVAGFPPKYTIAHFEEIGRACAVAALDSIESNPWSRISQSEYCSLNGVREWVRRYYRSFKGSPAKGSRIVPRVPTQRPTFQTSATNWGNLSRPRFSLADTTFSTASTSNVNDRRPPPARSHQAVPRRDSTHLASTNNRVQPFSQRRSSDTDQSTRPFVKRPSPSRVTTPPQKDLADKQSGHMQRKEPVYISFSKKDSNASSGFRPSTLNDSRFDRRRIQPFCPTRSSPDRLPSTVHHTHTGAPVGTTALVEFTDLHAKNERISDRHSQLKLVAEENTLRLRQGTLAQNAAFSSYQQPSLEEEEKKIQQLKDLCTNASINKPRRGNHILLNKTMEPPKSDPPKRKVARRLPGKRRSNSHSPKSGKGGRSLNSSGTDSDAERRRNSKKKKDVKKLLKDGLEESETDSRTGLQSVGIKGIKLSPRPTACSDITMQQMQYLSDKRSDKTLANDDEDTRDSGVYQQRNVLVRRHSSPDKIGNGETAEVPLCPRRWHDPLV